MMTNRPLSCIKAPVFIPIVSPGYKDSVWVWKRHPTPVVTLRLGDLLTRKNSNPNEKCFEIIDAGGVHEYFKSEAKFLLSSIMPDDMIKNFSVKEYGDLINALHVDYHFTPDGYTYHKRYSQSEAEIHRLVNATNKLIQLCPQSSPIGLLKGCTPEQIAAHMSLYSRKGIQDFVLHAGDYRRNGSPHMIRTAHHFASIIRKKARLLFLYGAGSIKDAVSHSFADAIISYNHFVMTDKGLELSGERTRRYGRGEFKEIMEKNYLQMHRNLNSLRYQSTLTEENLCLWEEAQQEAAEVAQAVAVLAEVYH